MEERTRFPFTLLDIRFYNKNKHKLQIFFMKKQRI